MPQTDYSPYAPAAPYFDLVCHALGEAVEGEHFFDIVAPDIAYEVLYDFPGWPRLTAGREALMGAFGGYVQHIALTATSDLVVHRAEGGRVFVLEYEVHGTILATERPYHNRICSIVTVADRKITYWRDSMDSLAAWNALTA
jgi:ketosteroid isomerase-like protein